ncbi:histone-like nucleoid-structuring protein Lsr2 [Nocardioides rubriscoriae]|uniref:histone-like nucleoid-structuring protein Lsr2 n=1 Tax=Nocardioides rubriscoriae TaxID=642762 RepID=UPI0011DF5F5E|nr:Lsr2 family protein [Nocardioides rubriscoriae]
MAQKVNIILVDDIDGSEANETVTFGLDGTSYEIDLNTKNAQALRDSLAGYIGYARKVPASARRSGGTRRSSAASSSNGGTSAAEIREWARSEGHEVPERGRIPAEIREAYDAAH